MKRVAVTGLGAVSPAGLDAASTWAGVREGRTGIGPLHCTRQEIVTCPIAAQVRDFDPAPLFDAKQLATLDRFSQFAVAAAREAMTASGLDRDDPAVRNAATIVGSGVGGMTTLDDAFYRTYGEKIARVHPFSVPRFMGNAAASQISMDLGLHGITYGVTSACASGSHAIGLAFQAVRSGASTVALAGGTEACVTAGTLIGWEALRVLSSDSCRPFSRNRSGLVLGEGAAMLVLEEWDHAVARGATIYGEILGFGANADAADLLSPDPENAAEAMRLALRDAGRAPSDIGYVNAHGTGTKMNDAVESQALRAVFGDAVPPVSSSKGVLGHSLGAAGALEAMIVVMALAEQVLPPTANCDQPDYDLGIDMVPEGPRPATFSAALSNSFAFGGLNAVLALGRV